MKASRSFADLAPCLIGMEACGRARYRVRQLSGFGHTVKLTAPQFVKPYVKTSKNDAADAGAIYEAVARPNMRFVPVHGARAVIRCARYKADCPDSWLTSLIERRHTNVAAVASANKNARIVWALPAHDRDYQAGYPPSVAAA